VTEAKASAGARRIFVECTYTFYAGGNSGIRRVARNLANYAPKVSTKDVEILPIVWGEVGFFTPRKPLNASPHPLWHAKYWFERWVKPPVVRAERLLAEIVGRIYQLLPLWLILPLRRLRLLFGRHLKLKKDIDPLWLLIGFTSFPLRFIFGRPVSFRSGDIVVLVDSTWNSSRMLDYLFERQADPGIHFGAMIHDLFPLTMPETCQQVTVEGFTRWFQAVVPRVDFFVTNSEATRRSLEEYLSDHPQLHPYKYRSSSFLLGAELDLSSGGEKPSQDVLNLWKLPGAAILAVGTIEPRKNYSLLLDAFDLLHAKGLDVSLVVIGHPGWKSGNVLKRIAQHPALGARLFYFSNASDADLAQAFDRAGSIVCSSLAEGFGLPVVEGMIHGLTVFASDIPVFREVGGKACRYFPLGDPDILARMLEDWLTEYERGMAAASTLDWPNWEESTRSFSLCVAGLAQEPAGS